MPGDGPSPLNVIDLVVVTAPKPPGSSTLISPPSSLHDARPRRSGLARSSCTGWRRCPTPEGQVRVAAASSAGLRVAGGRRWRSSVDAWAPSSFCIVGYILRWPGLYRLALHSLPPWWSEAVEKFRQAKQPRPQPPAGCVGSSLLQAAPCFVKRHQADASRHGVPTCGARMCSDGMRRGEQDRPRRNGRSPSRQAPRGLRPSRSTVARGSASQQSPSACRRRGSAARRISLRQAGAGQVAEVGRGERSSSASSRPGDAQRFPRGRRPLPRVSLLAEAHQQGSSS